MSAVEHSLVGAMSMVVVVGALLLWMRRWTLMTSTSVVKVGFVNEQLGPLFT